MPETPTSPEPDVPSVPETPTSPEPDVPSEPFVPGEPEEPSDPDTDLTVLKAVSKAEIERTAGTSPSAAVAALVSEGKAAVDAAETADEVEEAEERAISKIIDQLNREAADRASAAELAAAKEEAVNAVRKAAGERPSAAVKTIADTGVNEIINAEKVSAVRAAMNDTVSKIKAQRRTEAIKKIEGREPSHLTIGAKTYWVLDGVSYEDPECTKEITNLAEWVVIPAEGHKWNTEATVDREATCTEDGQKSVHCAGCDETKDTEVIEATGHSYGRWHITVLATGEHDGEKIRECEVCHETEKAATKYNRPAEDVKPSEPGSPAEEAGRVTQLNKALRVYISLPESIYSEDRDYVIVREHENHYTVIPLVHVSGTTYYFESDQFSTYYIAYSEKKHEHAFSEWKPSQDASWLHRGREERTCECGKKESRVVEESWTEWLYHGTVKLVKKFF